mmetsp:Transcript_22328/g.57197  ORF Transcript_22328/g.57197 Transcript_22328/m.57197 type:complete len:225 (+) Transcript_22328:97-771(+)
MLHMRSCAAVISLWPVAIYFCASARPFMPCRISVNNYIYRSPLSSSFFMYLRISGSIAVSSMIATLDRSYLLDGRLLLVDPPEALRVGFLLRASSTISACSAFAASTASLYCCARSGVLFIILLSSRRRALLAMAMAAYFTACTRSSSILALRLDAPPPSCGPRSTAEAVGTCLIPPHRWPAVIQHMHVGEMQQPLRCLQHVMEAAHASLARPLRRCRPPDAAR